MKKPEYNKREDLSATLGRLENFLCEHHYTPALWPIEHLDKEDIENFISALFRLSWECLAIHSRENMPQLPCHRSTSFASGDFLEMVHITRQLVQCCDELKIAEYRFTSQAENETILLLGQLHNALIGNHYFQHPGMDTAPAHEVRFARQIQTCSSL